MQNVFRFVGTLLSLNENGEGIIEITLGTVAEQVTVHFNGKKAEPGSRMQISGKFQSAADPSGRPATQLLALSVAKAKKGAMDFNRGRVDGIVWDRGCDYRDMDSTKQPFGWTMVDCGDDRIRIQAFNPLAYRLMYGDPNAKPAMPSASANSEVVMEGRIRTREFPRNDGSTGFGPEIIAEPVYSKVKKAGVVVDHFGDEGNLEAEAKKAAAI